MNWKIFFILLCFGLLIEWLMSAFTRFCIKLITKIKQRKCEKLEDLNQEKEGDQYVGLFDVCDIRCWFYPVD